MNGLSIREATIADLVVLRCFEQGVVTAERPFDPTIRSEGVLYYDLPAMLAAPHIYLVLAEWQGQPVGCGYARVESARAYLRHHWHAYLGFMYVVPEHRGKGINGAVIQALEEWSRRQGITELRLDVYEQNNPAITAYEKAGFERHMLQMRKGL